MKYLFRFKVIDHYSDICSPEEQTIIEAVDGNQALNQFYNDMDGESVYLISVEEWKY